MAVKTKGTQFYFIDNDATGGPEIVVVDCPTGISGLDASRDQIETTCLDSEAREYEAGLPTPGQITLNLNFDPSSDSHNRIYDLWRSGVKMDMALGWGDGTAQPTLDTSDEFDFPTSRTFTLIEDAFFQNVPTDFQLNAVVTAQVTIQGSGFPALFRKV